MQKKKGQILFKKRKTGNNHYEYLPIDPERKRGFARLPKPDSGDIFFDMEGDPLPESGADGPGKYALLGQGILGHS